ncbi:MAG: penicillin-binding protein 2, partial [Rubrivivax sp.]|nr:penicillin-binding protein 2 [Rubrivivax sp.]
MTELKDIERELGNFRGRLLAAAGFVLVAFALLGARLVHLQVFRHDELATRAEANRIAVVPIVPNRGLIVDRNGVVLASNYSAYTLEIATARAGKLEPLIDELATIVEIAPRDRRRFKRLLDEGKGFESLPIRTKLSDEEVARFMAQRYRFPGVEVKARLFRHYPLGEVGSHLLGYIGRINPAEKKAMEDWPEEKLGNYKGTEYIGKLGLEQNYEAELHGTAGFEEVETSAGGRAVRRLSSHPPTPGNKLVLSVDIRLQALVEELFGDRRGALVAIDPRSGEVLAFVSKPTFDPNLFVDGIDVESWRELNDSIDKPLLNRALRGTYPPGSTFKPFMAMAALNSGKRSASTIVNDGGSFQFGNHVFRSHGDKGLGPVDMYKSIVKSSNVYYYSLANEMGVDLMHEQLSPMGFGRRTEIDLEGEVPGLLPSTEWKRRAYKKPEQQRWYAGETISLGIGQGYNSFTMLQLASATATLSAGGQRFRPRLVREIEDVISHERRRIANDALEPLPYKAEHVAVINAALHGVTTEGTGTRVFAGAPYSSGGKTGTAQAMSVRQNTKYDAAKLEEHQRDHSLYIAVAPLEAPTVALAVVVENAGFGAAA